MFKSQIKLSVLRKLSERDLSGYELMNELGSDLGKKPSPGYIYPLLKDLKSKKFIKETVDGKKNIYSITKEGNRLLKDLVQKHEDMMKSMLKTFEPLSDKEEIKNYTDLMNKFKKNKFCIPKDSDVIEKLIKEVHESMENNYDKKRNDFRKVLENTAKDLRKINKKWKKQ